MKKLSDIIAFAFLGSLVLFGGFTTLTVRAQLQSMQPLVDAGPDKSVAVGQSFTVSGSAIDDSGVTAMSWVIAGSGCTISATTLEPFTTSGGAASAGAHASVICTVAGTYTATLTASDPNGSTQSDTIQIIVTSTTSISAACNNNILEGTEECDGTNLREKTCTFFGFTGGTLSCTDGCRFDKTSCTTSTSNTPNTNTTNTTAPHCSDGTVNTSSEQCDGTNLNGTTCSSLGYNGGTLSCTSSCQFNTSACTVNTGTAPAPVCNNNILEGTEECDKDQRRGFTCASFGFAGGTLSCSNECRFVKTACTATTSNTTNTNTTATINTTTAVCGNSILEGSEECDKGQLRGKTCAAFGYSTGTLSCSDSCKFNLSTCVKSTVTQATVCNNGIVEGLEECDGTQLRNVSCTFFGFSGGTLSCTKECRINKDACVSITEKPVEKTPECNNGIVEGLEECDGSEVRGFTCDRFGYASGTLRCSSKCTFDRTSCVAVKELTTNTRPITVPTVEPAPQSTSSAPIVSFGGTTIQEIQAARDYVNRCAELGITDPKKCKIFLSYGLPPECIKAGVTEPIPCEKYLKGQYLQRVCDANQLTGDACSDAVFDKYKTEISCGSLSEYDCRALAKERFIAQIATGAEERHALMIAVDTKINGSSATTGDIVKVVAESNLPRNVFPLDIDSKKTVLIRRSDRTIDISDKIAPMITAPYVIMSDDDGDGLPNDLEAYYGTNPRNSDSDNDGFNDISEINNGYDPLRPGGEKTIRVLGPTEIAVITNAAIEQPIAKGTETAEFKVQKIGPKAEEQATVLEGKAKPNSLVFIYIYSQMPLVLTVKTDSSGNWVYTLNDNLVDGRHTAYVAVTDDTGKVTEKSEPFPFFVRSAQAVTVNEFLKDQQVTQVAPKKDSFIQYYLIGGASVILLGLGVFFLIFSMRKNRNA